MEPRYKDPTKKHPDYTTPRTYITCPVCCRPVNAPYHKLRAGERCVHPSHRPEIRLWAPEGAS